MDFGVGAARQEEQRQRFMDGVKVDVEMVGEWEEEADVRNGTQEAELRLNSFEWEEELQDRRE